MKKACQHQKKQRSVTKVLLDQAGQIAGFYTLATGQPSQLEQLGSQADVVGTPDASVETGTRTATVAEIASPFPPGSGVVFGNPFSIPLTLPC